MTTFTLPSRPSWIRLLSWLKRRIKFHTWTSKVALIPITQTNNNPPPLPYDHQHSTYPSLMVQIHWIGFFKLTNISPFIKYRWTNAFLWWDFICRETLSHGLNGCTITTYSQIGTPSQGLWSFVLAPQHISIIKWNCSNSSKPRRSLNTKAGLNAYAIVWWVSLPKLYLIVSFLVWMLKSAEN